MRYYFGRHVTNNDFGFINGSQLKREDGLSETNFRAVLNKGRMERKRMKQEKCNVSGKAGCAQKRNLPSFPRLWMRNGVQHKMHNEECVGASRIAFIVCYNLEDPLDCLV